MFTFLRLIQLTSTWYDPCGSTGQESSINNVRVQHHMKDNKLNWIEEI